jgi:hypothetical protein
MAAITTLLLLFAHVAAPFAHASHAKSHLIVAGPRVPARRLLEVGHAVMQQHSYARQAARSLLQVANAITAQEAGQEAGQGAGQGAGLGAGQGAGQGAGAGAGQGSGLGAGQGAGQGPAQVANQTQVANQALAQATGPLATPAGTARLNTVAGAPPVLLPQQPAAAGAAPVPAQTGPTGVIITATPPTTAPEVQTIPTGALGAGSHATPAGSSVSSGPALKLWEQCGGRSACNGNTPCADSLWTSSSCSLDTTCIRQDEWYWQCRPSSELHQHVAGSSADGSGPQDPRQSAGQTDGQSNSHPVKGLMGQQDGQHQVMAQQGGTGSTPWPETAAGVQAAGGGGIKCIKRSGCQPSDVVYGSSDNKRSFAGLLAPAGQCQVSAATHHC